VKIPHCRIILLRKTGDHVLAKNITMEELLASQTKKLITFHRGQEIEGIVLAISSREITLDLGGKSEGILPFHDLPETISKDLKTGQKLKAFVAMPENDSGQVVLSSSLKTSLPVRFRGKGVNWQKFREVQNQKGKLQGTVIEVNKGGLIVEVDKARGFLPNSQVGFELLSRAGEGLENLIGQPLTVTVIEVDADNNKLIFSQRGQISEKDKEKLRGFKNGEKQKGKIVAILPFGLVVDVNGAEGLVFISDVSWDRVEDLSKEYQAGKEVEVLVLGIDEELGRLNLSIKQLTEDPFASMAKDYPADEVVKGEVVSVGEQGVMVK
jgi:small subunit ribosomal protein S1